MHPDIALLPGMLGYEWLGCGGNTMNPDEEMEAVDDYIEAWWKSKVTSTYRRNRRQPLFGRKPSGSIRRLFFNVNGAISSCPQNSTSSVNFANVVALVDIVVSILEEAEQNDKFLDVNWISILTPYNEQKEELWKYVHLYMSTMGYTRFPSVVTIDSMQGGQNAVIILDLTAANPKHGSSVGFMQTWNRLNVALLGLSATSVGFTARTCAHVLRYSFGWFEISSSKRIYLRVCDTFTHSFHACLRPEYSSDASMCVY